jgi:uncharacterized phage protein gp47/JayE
MPLDSLPGKLVLKTREQVKQLWNQFTLIRNPGADLREGSQVDQDGSVAADLTMLVQSNAVTVANGVSRSTATGPDVDTWIFLQTGGARGPSQGAGGTVSIQASSNGAQLEAGDLLTSPNGNVYEFTTAGTYQNGQPVPVAGVTKGSGTDLPAGSLLQIQTSRPGLTDLTAIVLPQADGSGLSGGAGAESDSDALARLQDLASNPPASGNEAEYRAAIEQIQTIGVQAAFAIPDVMAPGTIAVMFLLRPGTPGANRIPSAGQMAQVLSLIGGSMPGDDGIYMCAIVAFPVTLVLNVLWSSSSAGWADTSLFPLYHPPPAPDVPNTNLVAVAPNAGGAIAALAFRLQSPAMTEVPQVGQSVAFYDGPNQKFRRKKIATVTAITSTQYDITVDTSTGLSDTSYTPSNGQPCSPWSDSLQDLVVPLVIAFDSLGPSEQFASFFDPGIRQRRSPPSPNFWPNRITTRILGGALTPQPPQGPQQNQPPIPTVYGLLSIDDVELVEPAPPFSAPVGSPGVFSNLLTLGTILAFPE